MVLQKNIKLTFEKMSPTDLGKTNREGDVITFNTMALRDRSVTNAYLNEDKYLSSTEAIGMAHHEMGHVISIQYGENGFEIAREAWYNITKERLSTGELLNCLQNEISQYSTFITEDKKEKPFKAKYYKEITPEMLGKNKTNPSAFTTEFVRLLKEKCGVGG